MFSIEGTPENITYHKHTHKKWYEAKQSIDLMSFSLVPRPFPPPVFNRLQYAKKKQKRKAWEKESHV